jgi:hypothetical protein
MTTIMRTFLLESQVSSGVSDCPSGTQSKSSLEVGASRERRPEHHVDVPRGTQHGDGAGTHLALPRGNGHDIATGGRAGHLLWSVRSDPATSPDCRVRTTRASATGTRRRRSPCQSGSAGLEGRWAGYAGSSPDA